MEKARPKRARLRRILALACTLVLALGMAGALAACGGSSQSGQQSGQAQTKEFTDSAGRTVEVPTNIDKIAPSGHTANQVLFTVAPEKMAGLSQKLSDDQLKYFDKSLADLPVFGAAFGAKGDMNKEAVAASGAQIVIDTGEYKDGLKEDLDNLQDQLGIPVVFIETPLDDWGSAYRKLGDLLGMQDRCETLAAYCDSAYKEVNDAVSKVPADKRVRVAYLLGDSGLNAIAKGSYQGTVIDLIADNVVEVEKASGSGAGNEISLEQIGVWNPDLIVFGANSIYSTVGSDAAWSGISAIAHKNYYEVPSTPWTWLNNPPTVNQVLGMQWFARLCYPDQFSDDLQNVVTDYYKTFYNYDLTQDEYNQLVEKAVRK